MRYNQKCTVYKVDKTSDGMGGHVETYSPESTIKASIHPASEDTIQRIEGLEPFKTFRVFTKVTALESGTVISLGTSEQKLRILGGINYPEQSSMIGVLI